jgi:transposase
MQITTIGIDLAKTVFQLHAVDADGKAVVRKRLRRAEVLSFFVGLEPCLIGMEACATSHYWARELAKFGHTVKLMPPAYVKPYVKRGKNDATDAEAICEAVARPNMRFVPVKSAEQQDLQSLHRTRERIVCTRTALINHMRGLLGEYGVILPQGARLFLAQARDAIAGAELSDLAHDLFTGMLDELGGLDLRLEKLDKQLAAICRTNEACRRLSKLPGVGPVVATALVAAVDDGRHR